MRCFQVTTTLHYFIPSISYSPLFYWASTFSLKVHFYIIFQTRLSSQCTFKHLFKCAFYFVYGFLHFKIYCKSLIKWILASLFTFDYEGLLALWSYRISYKETVWSQGRGSEVLSSIKVYIKRTWKPSEWRMEELRCENPRFCGWGSVLLTFSCMQISKQQKPWFQTSEPRVLPSQ